MNPRFRKVAVFVGAAAVAGAVGVGVATQGGEASGGSRDGIARQVADGQGMPGPGAMDRSALANALGVTESRLEAALQSARPSPGSGAGGAPSDPGEDPLVAALAQELGISEAKVAAALEQLRPPGRGMMPPGNGGGTPPSWSTAPDGSTAPSTGTAEATRA